ncbi:hypothetical protein Patl1_11489 [Pistacia atlantica]|uniref:Uncharacterized protein n=1 Tax=Pistacia atlantica TaxID=434234 RepID=A0ACC1A7M0_9ROSI|nr:hypothetical protein Patl1_11489 [Pistacia atlantica]
MKILKFSSVASILLLLLNLSRSWGALDPVYETFLQCFTKRTNSTDDKLSSIVYNQESRSFSSVLRAYIRNARFNSSSTPKPTVIITPLEESHVQAAVICAKQVNFQLKIRSGGHDYEGLSYKSENPFFILDMFNIRNVDIDMKEETAWVGAGATLGEVYYKISEKSSVHGFPAGVCPTVGVGGHFSGAGYGTMLRKFGLSTDNVVDAKIVDVQGRILDRKGMGEDLFWAIRGGGGASFGVVLSYKLKLVSVPQKVTVFKVERLVEENATEIAYKWQFVAPATDNNLFMRMLLQPTTKNKKTTAKITVIALYLGLKDNLMSLLDKEFPELGLKKEDCMEMRWVDSVLWWSNFDLNTTKPDALLDRKVDWADFVEEEIRLRRMSEIPATETPFPHRDGNLFKVQYSITWEKPDPELEKNYTSQVSDLYNFMTPFVSKNPRGAYLNYRDLDIGMNHNGKDSYEEGKVYGAKYFNGNFDRLVKVKTMVDPENFFRTEQSIPVLPK